MKMRRTILFGFFVIFIISLGQGRAFAWGKTWMGAALEQMVMAARWKVGAFRYNALFRLDNAGYDSDIYFGSLANAVPDYTVTGASDIQIFLPLKKKIVFDISESPQYVFFFDTKRERALNNTFAGRVHFVFDRFYIQAGGALIDTKQRLSTEVNLNVRLKEDDLTGLLLWQASKETSFALQFRKSTFNYENPTLGTINIGENLNRKESLINFRAYLQRHSKTRFYLDGEYGSFVFTGTTSRLKDARSYGAYGGVDFVPSLEGQSETSGVRGKLILGYKRFDILRHDAKDYSGLVGDTGVSIGIFKFTAIRVFFSRGPQFSAYSGLAYYLETICGAGLARSLSRRTVLTYDLNYGQNEYPGGITIEGEAFGKRVDKYLGHSIRLSFRPRRNLEVNLIANVGRRNSKFAPRPVSRHYFLGFNLTYGYSLPVNIFIPGVGVFQ